MKNLSIAFILLITGSTAFSGEIALSFDDAPLGDGWYFTGEQRTSELIKSLDSIGIKTAFFCTPRTLNNSRKNRLEAYASKGHIIANHTDTHPDLTKVMAPTYISNIEVAHKKLKSFKTFRRWFRFPFLREGNTREKRDKVRAWLTANRYINGYVTIDNYDWYMNKLFQDALKNGRKVNFKNLKKVYLEVLWQGIKFYDEIAVKTLGRSPKHVLLLHENDLAALFVDDLVRFIRFKGWKIVTPTAAYNDPISKIEPDTLLLSQGRVAAIARTRGYKPSQLVSKWEDESALEKVFEDSKVFE